MARQSGKPENVIEKMVEGRMRKFYEEIGAAVAGLRHRRRDAGAKVLEKAAKDLGAPVEIAGFRALCRGRGHREGESDFAAEVAQMAGRVS